MADIFDSFRHGKPKEHSIREGVRDQGFLEVLQNQPFEGLPFRLPTEAQCENLSQGTFEIGTIGFHQEKLRETPEEFHRGLGIIGGTRTGKTWFLRLLAIILATLINVGVLIADVKGDFKKLAAKGYRVINLRDLPFNPLELVPGTDITAHAWEVALQIAGAYCLHNSATVLARLLVKMFTESGQPTLAEYQQQVHQLKPGPNTGIDLRQTNALKGRIDQLCMVLGPTICNTRHGFMPHQHAKDKIVINLNAGCPNTHAFFVTWMDWELYTFNKTSDIRPDKLTTAIIVDESSFLLFSRPDFPPYIDELICRHGEFGIGLIAASQLSFSTAFQANAAWKILLKSGDARLLKIQADAMGMTHHQILWANRSLGGQGNAIILTPRHPEPLLITLTPLNEKFPTDYSALAPESAKNLINQIATYTKQKTKKPDKQIITAQSAKKDCAEMMPSAIKLLKYAAATPASSTTDCYKGANLGIGTGDDALKFLTDNNMAKTEKVRLYKGRGRQPVLIEITQKGLSYLKAHHPDTNPKGLAGRGSLTHRVHAELIARHYDAKGFVVRKEAKDSDIGIQDPTTGEWFAVEIVTANETNLEHRIVQNTKAGAERTLIICSDTAAVKRVQKRVGDTAEVKDIKEYLLKRGEPLRPQHKGEKK